MCIPYFLNNFLGAIAIPPLFDIVYLFGAFSLYSENFIRHFSCGHIETF